MLGYKSIGGKGKNAVLAVTVPIFYRRSDTVLLFVCDKRRDRGVIDSDRQ
jgi:hypothetical protein